MAVIARIAGREFARPVDGEAHGLELGLHGGDVGVGPLGGVGLALHGGVLGRHAEGVPAHGVEDIEAAGALVAGEHIAHGIVSDVPHMDAPGGVRKHLEHVALGLGRVGRRTEGPARFPDRLPVLLAFGRVIAFGGHGATSVSVCRTVGE